LQADDRESSRSLGLGVAAKFERGFRASKPWNPGAYDLSSRENAAMAKPFLETNPIFANAPIRFALIAVLAFPVQAWSAPPEVESAQASARNGDLIPPNGKNQLLRWLKAGAYRRSFLAEPAVHPSAGPHGGNVLTFYNPILAEDLQAGKTAFRKGAAMVKELYFDGFAEVAGYSVMVKANKKSGPEGKGWLFYETFDGTNRSVFFGRGVPVCVNCHRGGVDYLLSSFRP
jgi:hypothetical protein